MVGDDLAEDFGDGLSLAEFTDGRSEVEVLAGHCL